jgi:hypothetical protein
VYSGAAVESLRARREELISTAVESRSGRTRAEIEALTRRQPRSFPQGFGETIANARYDRTVIGRLATTLLEA